MPTVCGIELKSSEAILVVVESTIGSEVLIDTEPKKIKIGVGAGTPASVPVTRDTLIVDEPKPK